MGLKDQFHDKAKRLAEQAMAGAQGAQDEAAERSRDAQAQPHAEKARETFDDQLDK
ncbi:hypothetical protein ABZX75_16275 [Streptomyces sp. NPDC003038]|uniref:hypothetical protein n=1 Tax=unclassified Streptomyces TaxID=2593676 RepID=UPI0033A48B51